MKLYFQNLFKSIKKKRTVNENIYFSSIIAVQFFYLLLVFLLHFRLSSIALFNDNISHPAEYLEILSWIPKEFFSLFVRLTGWCGIAVILVCSIYPWSRILRTIVFITILFSIAIDSSYGKVIHGFYGFLFASLALIFLPSKENVDRQTIFPQVLFCAQFSSIICYALAGLWKLRYLPSIYNTSGFNGVFDVLGNAIAYEHTLHSHTVSSVTLFFLNHDLLTGVLFLGLIALQTISPILVLFEKMHLIFGVFILTFHLLSEIIVKIPFRSQTLLMILFFIILPVYRLVLRSQIEEKKYHKKV